MSKRRTADQIAKLLRDAERDLAKGLTVADLCRKLGIAENTYYRWRQHHDPAQIDESRRIRELETEVERLKLLVAELLLDKKMLQEVAKKSGDRYSAAGQRGTGAGAFDASLPAAPAFRRGRLGARYPAAGASAPALWLSAYPCPAGQTGLDGEPQAGTAAVERVGSAAARALAKLRKLGPKPGSSAGVHLSDESFSMRSSTSSRV
jgi:putative transposase